MSILPNFQPHLFICNISKNITKETIWNVFANLGFGIIHNIVIKDCNKPVNCAVVYYEMWNIDDTRITRNMLMNGKSLNISYTDDDKTWKVYAYDETKTKHYRVMTAENNYQVDFLHPNVTDNRKHRMLNYRDTRCYAPLKPKRTTTINNDNNNSLLIDIICNLNNMF